MRSESIHCCKTTLSRQSISARRSSGCFRLAGSCTEQYDGVFSNTVGMASSERIGDVRGTVKTVPSGRRALYSRTIYRGSKCFSQIPMCSVIDDASIFCGIRRNHSLNLPISFVGKRKIVTRLSVPSSPFRCR